MILFLSQTMWYFSHKLFGIFLPSFICSQSHCFLVSQSKSCFVQNSLVLLFTNSLFVWCSQVGCLFVHKPMVCFFTLFDVHRMVVSLFTNQWSVSSLCLMFTGWLFVCSQTSGLFPHFVWCSQAGCLSGCHIFQWLFHLKCDYLFNIFQIFRYNNKFKFNQMWKTFRLPKCAGMANSHWLYICRTIFWWNVKV